MAEAMELCSSAQENPLKRPLPVDNHDTSPMSTTEHSEVLPTPPLTASPNHDKTKREVSPAHSTSTLSSVATSTQEQPSGSTTLPPQKKRKLTFAEKQEQQAEKEKKQRERDEQKAKKDEEKRIKDEEKRRKKEEKEAKDREKDLEKQRKENEKQKKERAQMKLGNFFTKPKLPTTTSPVIPQSPVKELTIDLARRKSLSIEPADKMTTQSTTPKREQEQKSDYKRKFLPFQPPSYTTCAPHVLYPPDDAEVMKFDNILERVLKGEPSKHGPAPVSSFFVFGRPRSRGIWQPNAREVVESLNGSSHNPIDLESGETCRPEDLLKSVTIRHLHFAEDVRPPYVGSYTKSLSPKSSAKLRRRPCERIRKDTNYDYDSEAEWEEPEEGEDLLSDGEDDDESIGAPDEMEDFLDEDEAGPKRRLLTGDLKPTSTGLCWHGSGIANPESSIDMDSMKIEFFIDIPTHSINPLSGAYWPKEGAQSRAVTTTLPTMPKSVSQTDKGKIVSPGHSIQPRLSIGANGTTLIGAARGMSGPIMAAAPGKITKQATKPLDGQDLKDFGDAVVGSNVPKTDLLKALKKRFPQHTNDAIKATLTDCFLFAGNSRAEKKWVYAD